MANHTKPTPEELEANIKKTQEDLEKLEKIPEETPEEAPKEEIKEGETIDTAPSEEVAERVEEEQKEEIDYKKKFIASSQEAQILHAKNKKFSEAVESVAETDVTEEELTKEYTDWDVMSETERKLAKKAYLNDKRFDAIHKATQEGKDLEKWVTEVDTFASSPATLTKYQELEGKTDEFKAFATKPTRRGVDFEDLVASFLYTAEKEAKPKHKGKMFESGTGGPNEKFKPKSDKLSVLEARNLMKTNYPKYKEYLKAGRIETIEE